MKVLFDQNVPRNLARFLTQHEVLTAANMGWGELKNGDLLKAAEGGGFEVLVTCDQNWRYQQNLKRRTIGILEIKKNNWPLTKPHFVEIVATVDAIQPGEYKTVECDSGPRRRIRRTFGPTP
jgi:hypothetical protein